jgi:hypothetical protein
VYIDGQRAGTPHVPRFTISGLTCATRHRLTVLAVGARGRRSGRSHILVWTAPCAAATPLSPAAPAGPSPPAVPTPPSTPAPARDTVAPTAPTALSIGSVTVAAIPLSWKASTDNVGVVGYNVVLDGVQLSQLVAGTTFTFSGLSCASSHELGVQAVDAAGNASPLVVKTAKTAACPPPPAPPPSASGSCPANQLEGVQRPGQLTLLGGCRTAVGRVTSLHIEHDGDCHVNVAVDPPYANLLNSVNSSAAGGDLVTEVIPSHQLALPDVGSRVSIFGTWVNDKATGWNELHPVWSYQLISGGMGPC